MREKRPSAFHDPLPPPRLRTAYSDAGRKNSDLFLLAGFLDMLDLDLIAPGCHLRDVGDADTGQFVDNSRLGYSAIRHWNLLWAWPRDGKRPTLEGAGVPLMRQYADAGLDMMHEHAQFEDGGVSVEAGLMEMADRMRGGRWKVFKGQNDAWLEELRLYHRDANGRVVAENDDAISASRYGLMMRRHARVADWKSRFYRPLEYPNRGIA